MDFREQVRAVGGYMAAREPVLEYFAGRGEAGRRDAGRAGR